MEGINLRTSEPHVFWEDIWNAVHITSQVTHGSNYMLANNWTESDRVVRKNGGHKEGSPQHMKEVIYTQLRDHLKQLFKGSLKMLNN